MKKAFTGLFLVFLMLTSAGCGAFRSKNGCCCNCGCNRSSSRGEQPECDHDLEREGRIIETIIPAPSESPPQEIRPKKLAMPSVILPFDGNRTGEGAHINLRSNDGITVLGRTPNGEMILSVTEPETGKQTSENKSNMETEITILPLLPDKLGSVQYK